MPPRPLYALIFGVCCAAFAAVAFAGDIALGLVPDRRIEGLAATDEALAKRLSRVLIGRHRIHARWLTLRVAGISAAAVVLGAAAGDALGGSYWRVVALSVATAVLTYGTLAEALRTVARRRPETFAAFALRYLYPFEWAAIPVADPLAWLGEALVRRVPEKRAASSRITENEVEYAVSEGERSGAIGEEPAEMIRNVLDFKDLTVREVMLPRKRISAVELGTPLAEVLRFIASEAHSRYPVYQETMDNVVGLLHAKDLFARVANGELDSGLDLSELVRKPALLVISTQSALSVLREMRARRQHLAIVADEFGGTEGVVTLEDILEEIVGDINDEFDTELPIVKLAEGHFLADAAVPLDDLEPYVGAIAVAEDAEFESLGGLLLHLAGKVPAVGARIEWDKLEFVVREADDRRVAKVEIFRRASTPPTAT